MRPTESPPSIWGGLAQIYAHASATRQRQFYVVLALMVVGALAELATIGSVLPFLALISKSGGVPGALPGDRLITAGLLFALVVTLAGLIRLQLTRSTQDFAYGLGNDLTVDIERRILLQPYAFHASENSARLLAMLSKVEDFVFEVLLPSMQALTAAFLAIAITAALIYLDPLTAIVAAAAFTTVYLAVSIIARKRLALNSEVTANSISERLQIAQESLGGIRDVIIDGTCETHLGMFARVNARLYQARANTAFIANAPRFIIETAGLIIVAAIAVVVARRDGSLAAALPTLGAIALGAQRLLPLVHQVYSGSSTAHGARVVLGEIVDFLQLPEQPAQLSEEPTPLPFRDRLRVDGVSFTYESRQEPALHDISFEIPRGSSVAIVGETGSGKSTLADLLMGLLTPDRGSISIDRVTLGEQNLRRWQRNIAHVPQSIFLADASITRNIALSVAGDEPDIERVIEASKMAQLHEFVETLPQGYETLVGERGVRLSGGQRQRLGLARATYKRAPVLVLDEPTSSLDYRTEAAVIEALEELRRAGSTIIIIAHRNSTISRCDLVARLADGRLIEFGPASKIRSAETGGSRSNATSSRS